MKVIAKSENRTKAVVQTKAFTMIIDEPASLGGTMTALIPLNTFWRRCRVA